MVRYINHFRPMFEARAAAGWALGLVLIAASGMPHAGYFAALCTVMLLLRGTQVWRALAFRMAISTKWLAKIRIDQLLGESGQLRKSDDAMYLGTGFEWTQKHCQIAHVAREVRVVERVQVDVEVTVTMVPSASKIELAREP